MSDASLRILNLPQFDNRRLGCFDSIQCRRKPTMSAPPPPPPPPGPPGPHEVVSISNPDLNQYNPKLLVVGRVHIPPSHKHAHIGHTHMYTQLDPTQYSLTHTHTHTPAQMHMDIHTYVHSHTHLPATSLRTRTFTGSRPPGPPPPGMYYQPD